jgi:MFS family permease
MHVMGKALPPALAFIILMGIVSLFSDMTHEGAASILGAFLVLTGASAAVIGFISGLGELVGYSLRIVFGYLADKTQRYWTLTIAGYIIDCVAISLLALIPENGWIFACGLIVMQRIGKAIKKPAKNTLMSFASVQFGPGKTFGLLEMLDQIGAFLGPLLVFLTLLLQKSSDTFSAYSLCFAVLAIPAFITIVLLFSARYTFPEPEKFEPEPATPQKFRLTRPYLLYIVGISFFAFGFVDYALVTMHVYTGGLLTADLLPLLYAGAMLIDAVAALLFGWLYDKYGIKILIVSTLMSSLFAVFIFLGTSLPFIVLGVLLWGVGMGAQESILKAVVTTIVPKHIRSTGFGIFETSFGIFWFFGSWLMGFLYDIDPIWLVVVSVSTQLAAVSFYYRTSILISRSPALYPD